MHVRDAATAGPGITLERIAPGPARMRMAATETVLDGREIRPGASPFAPADTTFAVVRGAGSRVAVASSAHRPGGTPFVDDRGTPDVDRAAERDMASGAASDHEAEGAR